MHDEASLLGTYNEDVNEASWVLIEPDQVRSEAASYQEDLTMKCCL